MQSNISVRIDETLKQQFDSLCSELGLTMSAAVNLFIKAVIREKGLPFAISINDYNSETKRVIQETEQGKGLSKEYADLNEMFKDLNID